MRAALRVSLWLVLSAWLLQPVDAQPQHLPSPLLLTVDGSSVAASEHLWISRGTFSTAEDALQHIGDFVPLTAERFAELPDTTSFWIALHPERPAQAPAEWLVELGWHHSFGYLYDGSRLTPIGQTGVQMPLAERHVSEYPLTPMLRLQLPPGQPLTLLVHVTHDARTYMASSLQWDSAVQLHGANRWEGLWAQRTFASSLYFGALLALGLFHLLLYFSLRNTAYLWYAAVMVCWGICWGDTTGVLSSALYPATLPYFKSLWFYLLIGGVVLFHAFSVVLLDLRQATPWLYRAVLVTIGLALPIVVLGLAHQWGAATLMAAFWALLGLILQLTIAVVLTHRKHELGNVYLAAVALPLLGGFVYIFAWLGWLPVTEVTRHAFVIGSMGQAILFSLALATRIKLVEQRQQNALLEEAQTRRRLMTLREQDAFKSELLGLASHDLKNPLHNILGFTELLQQQTPETKQRHHTALQSIHRSADQMLEILDALLQTSAIEQGRLALNAEPTDLAAVLREVLETHTPHAQAKQHTLQLEVAASPSYGWVEGSSTYLRSVFDNLISNAIKYAPEGATTRVSLVPLGDTLKVDVHDEGPGLSQEDQKLLFKPFQRLSPQPTAGESSTGVGLALAKRLVELHGGTISASSVQGEGSTFTVTLPRLDRAATPQPSAVPSH